MAAEGGDTARAGAGFKGGFGRGRDGKRGDKRGPRGPRRARDAKDGEWIPVTRLGRLVKEGLITNVNDIFLFSMPIKESSIVDTLFPNETLFDEVMKIMPVQKQTSAGQRTRFKAFVIVGDKNGHLGMGVKCAKEVAIAIRGGIIAAKMALIPVRRGFWGDRFGDVHTVPAKTNGKCGSVSVRIIPAPRGTGLVASPAPKKVMELAGISDAYTSSTGQTACKGNFVKATYAALKKTYSYLTPDWWTPTEFNKTPFQEHTDFLKDPKAGKRSRKPVKDAN
jgi:small subunit ribosomal protein S2e